MLESFRSSLKLFDRYPSWMQHLTKDILNTKRTEIKLGSDFPDQKLCDLCALCG